MHSTWEILKKELAIYNIDLIDNKHCISMDLNNKKTKISLNNKISMLNQNICENVQLLIDVLADGLDLLLLPLNKEQYALDIKSANLFTSSLRGMLRFSLFVLDDYTPHVGQAIRESCIKESKEALNKDIYHFEKDVIKTFPSFKIALDWIHRVICNLFYIRKLLKFALKGRIETNKLQIKTAKGIQGPWGNLDLPMLERNFAWDDIQSEIRGRDRDIKKQRRYEQGLENYNNDGRVGEGFYWREIRNEPFAWADRGAESPYPSRSLLMR